MCSSGPFVHVCIYINIVDLITIGRIEKNTKSKNVRERGLETLKELRKMKRTCGSVEWSGVLLSKFWWNRQRVRSEPPGGSQKQ